MNAAEKKALKGTLFVIVLGMAFAFAGSDSGLTAGGVSVFAICVMIAFVMQWIAFVPAYLRQTETFFDLTGGLTYIVTAVAAYGLSGTFDLRSTVLFLMVLIWATRLASFLFKRVLRSGKDGRFDELKPSFLRFLGAWTLQGLWVTFTSAAAWAAMTSASAEPADGWLIVGVVVWGVGFGIEAVADWQKKRFSAKRENEGKFIQEGLWACSRHPNYLGEIVLWIGVALVALPVLEGWQWVTLSSPFFVALLLIRVSGIPLLEKRADEKWGGDEEYERYKRETPVLLFKFGKR
ncbi:DUF1295 domain-containing protein [Pelagicoccus mobilis]|uniref:DUF1295 domain-containing protein n=1 Tax=Pelagicoccus mobilis TaxID=415221 RepID=A0A934RSU5_9BACT|nr:DUF1295 domain-containing protein [Pelagicoccus mobilis]MBK1876227.1 DUF1295 domain-containing protein [Pelagicoccus mobilis]